jgi:hypothetical protein
MPQTVDDSVVVDEFDLMISLRDAKLNWYYTAALVKEPLWSSGHSSWLQIQRFRVRFPALPDFLRSNGSGTGSTQPRGDN